MDPAREPAPPTDERPLDRATVLGDGLAWTARWSLRIVAIALGAVLLGVLIGQLWSVMLPVFLGLIIATVFEPFVTWLRGHGWPSLLATLLVFVAFLALIVGLVAALVPTVAAQAPQIAQGAAGGIQSIQDWLSGPPFNLGQTQIGQAVQAATDRLQQNATTIAGGIVTGLTAVAGGVVDAVLALVLAFLFVKDGPRFLPWLTRFAGTRTGGHLEAVGRGCWKRLGGFIRSQAIIGFVDAACIGIGLALFGVPLALPLAVLTFFGAFIPIVGALVAGILSVLIALVIKGFTVAVGVLILIIAVQQIEGNLLQPLVQGKGLGLHAAVVILAVTGGGSLFGIAGAFLAVPVTAVAAEILRYLARRVDEQSGGRPDDPVPPGEADDRGEPDATVRPDGAGPDGAGPDGAGPDGAGPDGAGPDGAGPDGAAPTVGGPSTVVPSRTRPSSEQTHHHSPERRARPEGIS